MLINTSPEPVSNWTASITEDILVIGGLWTALNHPILFLCLLALFIVIMIWLLPKIWRGIKKIFAAIKGFFSRNDGTADKATTDSPSAPLQDSAASTAPPPPPGPPAH